MKWLRLIFILSLPFLVVGLIGWQRGGVCDDSGPIEERWVSEARVDTIGHGELSKSHLERGIGMTASSTNLDDITKGIYIDAANEYFGYSLLLGADSMLLDSIGYVFYSNAASASDSMVIEVGLIQHTPGHFRDYEVAMSDTFTITAVLSAEYIVTTNQAYRRGQNPYCAAVILLQRDGSTQLYIVDLICYYDRISLRYGLP